MKASKSLNIICVSVIIGFVYCACAAIVGSDSQSTSTHFVVGKNIVKRNIESAKFIVSGKMLKLLKKESGYDLSSGKKTKGNWCEIEFQIENLMKGGIAAETIPIRFFLPDDLSLDFAPPPPDGNSYILFLKKTDADKGIYFLVLSMDPLVQVLDESLDLSSISGVISRLKAVLKRVIVAGSVTKVTPAVNMLMAISGKKDGLILLQELTDTARVGVRGIILAYRLSLGDTNVADEIDKILESNKATREEMDTIAATLMQIKDARLRPFLARWISCKDKTVSESAYRTLVTFEEKSLVPLMISALDHEDSLIRLRALHSLSKIEGPRKKRGKQVGFNRDDHREAVSAWKTWWQEDGKARYSGASAGASGSGASGSGINNKL